MATVMQFCYLGLKRSHKRTFSFLMLGYVQEHYERVPKAAVKVLGSPRVNKEQSFCVPLSSAKLAKKTCNETI